MATPPTLQDAIDAIDTVRDFLAALSDTVGPGPSHLHRKGDDSRPVQILVETPPAKKPRKPRRPGVMGPDTCQSHVYRIVAEAAKPMEVPEIERLYRVAGYEMPPGSLNDRIRMMLFRLIKRGLVRRAGHGTYEAEKLFDKTP